MLEGVGQMRVGEETLTVPKYSGVLVGPNQLRQVFNDTEEETLWLIIGAPEEMEFLLVRPSLTCRSFTRLNPTQLPKELAGVAWSPKG